MKKHIFVATDGSDHAAAAVDLAAELAARFDLPLTIGHVLRFDRPSEELLRMAEVEHIVDSVSRASDITFQLAPGTPADLFAPSRPRGDILRVITMMGEEILRRAADRAAELGATKVTTRLGDGDPADEIIDMAEKVGADMIVVGHRGLGRLRSLLLGSVAHKVMQHAECTVMAVR